MNPPLDNGLPSFSSPELQALVQWMNGKFQNLETRLTNKIQNIENRLNNLELFYGSVHVS